MRYFMVKYYNVNPENIFSDNTTLLRIQDSEWNSYSKTITQADVLQQPYIMLGSIDDKIEQMDFGFK